MGEMIMLTTEPRRKKGPNDQKPSNVKKDSQKNGWSLSDQIPFLGEAGSRGGALFSSILGGAAFGGMLYGGTQLLQSADAQGLGYLFTIFGGLGVLVALSLLMFALCYKRRG